LRGKSFITIRQALEAEIPFEKTFKDMLDYWMNYLKVCSTAQSNVY